MSINPDVEDVKKEILDIKYDRFKNYTVKNYNRLLCNILKSLIDTKIFKIIIDYNLQEIVVQSKIDDTLEIKIPYIDYEDKKLREYFTTIPTNILENLLLDPFYIWKENFNVVIRIWGEYIKRLKVEEDKLLIEIEKYCCFLNANMYDREKEILTVYRETKAIDDIVRFVDEINDCSVLSLFMMLDKMPP